MICDWNSIAFFAALGALGAVLALAGLFLFLLRDELRKLK